jgi:6-phosphogluconolactonase (cycloisomerase 2 family)
MVVVGGKATPTIIDKFAFGVSGDNKIFRYSVDSDPKSLGALTKIETIDVVGAGPQVAIADPTGRFLYITNSSKKSVSQYSIGPLGELSPLTPATAETGAFPEAIAITPNGRYAYVVNQSSGTISQFSVETTGVLDPLTPSAIAPATTGVITDLDVDPSGKFVYVICSDDLIVQYSIGPNGSLLANTPSNVVVGSGLVSATISPSGKWLYVANANMISQLAVAENGTISATSVSNVPAGSSPQHIALDAQGTYALVLNTSSTDVSQFVVDRSSGKLTALVPARIAMDTSSRPYFLTIAPSGHSAYVVDNRSTSGYVWQYEFSLSSGLKPMSSPSVEIGTYARSLAVSFSHH